MAGDSRTLIQRYAISTEPLVMGLREIETFQQFDWASAFAALEAAGTPVSDADKESIRSFIANYGTDTSATIAAQQAKEHRDVLDVVRAARDVHEKAIDLTAPTTPPPAGQDQHWICPNCCVPH